ncbi:MAG: hypothetical protein OHK0024_32810 [Thalassobaculales bacterium]
MSVDLAPLAAADISAEWCAWLADAEVMRWRAAEPFAATPADLAAYLDAAAARGDRVFAVRLDGRHVGNIALNAIDPRHASAELSIMIGARDAWGRGVGRAAVAALAPLAFASGLNRLWAESPNPAFNAVMRRLGWRHEGVRAQAFRKRGMFFDTHCWARLAEDPC